MSTLRVTSSLMVHRVLRNLSRQTNRILSLQEQLATGLRVNAPSDDPMATRLAIDTRAAIGSGEQYEANIQSATPLLAETESTVSTALEYLSRVSQLAQQGSNGTYNQAQRDSIAIEVNQLLEGLVATANHETNGRYIFAGTRTQTVPFEVARNAAGEITAVTYQGNDERTEVAVADGVRVYTNETGSDVFQAGQDVFQILIGIRDNLRAGNTEAIRTTNLTEVADATQQLLRSQARIGAVQNRLERASADIEEFIFQYKSLLSDTIEGDYADTLINLNAQSNAYQAALNAAARVIQPSLLDFVQ